VQSLGHFSYDLSLEVMEFGLGVGEGDVDSKLRQDDGLVRLYQERSFGREIFSIIVSQLVA